MQWFFVVLMLIIELIEEHQIVHEYFNYFHTQFDVNDLEQLQLVYWLLELDALCSSLLTLSSQNLQCLSDENKFIDLHIKKQF
jgi:hypothetical protein